MSDELKPCPFCGKSPHINFANNVWCVNPLCFMGDGDDDGTFAPRDLWNTRPVEDALRRELAAAREAIEYTLSQLEYMRMLWGGEGVTDGIAQRLKDARKEAPDEQA